MTVLTFVLGLLNTSFWAVLSLAKPSEEGRETLVKTYITAHSSYRAMVIIALGLVG